MAHIQKLLKPKTKQTTIKKKNLREKQNKNRNTLTSGLTFSEVVQNGKSMNPSFSEDSVAETTCLKNVKNSDGKSTRSCPGSIYIHTPYTHLITDTKKEKKQKNTKEIIISYPYTECCGCVNVVVAS